MPSEVLREAGRGKVGLAVELASGTRSLYLTPQRRRLWGKDTGGTCRGTLDPCLSETLDELDPRRSRVQTRVTTGTVSPSCPLRQVDPCHLPKFPVQKAGTPVTSVPDENPRRVDKRTPSYEDKIIKWSWDTPSQGAQHFDHSSTKSRHLGSLGQYTLLAEKGTQRPTPHISRSRKPRVAHGRDRTLETYDLT